MDKTLEKAHSSSNFLKSGQRNNVLVAQCRDELFRMNRNDANTTCFVDFSLDDLGDTRSQSLGGLGRLSIAAGGRGSGPVLLPEAPASKLFFDLFLLRGTEGNEKVVGQAKCYVDQLIRSDSHKAQSSSLLKLDGKLGTPTLKEIVFTKTISK
jgi:hypothetical protein